MKVLFICPKFFGYEIKIKEAIEKHLNAEVLYFNLEDFKYNYKNIFEKLYNNLI